MIFLTLILMAIAGYLLTPYICNYEPAKCPHCKSTRFVQCNHYTTNTTHERYICNNCERTFEKPI